MLNTITHGSSTDRPDLLIAHGLFGSGRNWGVISKRLSDERKITAVDMRNHGLSPWYNSHKYEELAEDLAEVIGDAQVDVLGHSMGGKAAMVLALNYPEKINKLIVADIAPIAYQGIDLAPIKAMRGVDLSRVERRSDALGQMQGVAEELKSFLLQSLDIGRKAWRLNLDVLESQMALIRGFPDMSGKQFPGEVLFLTGATSDYMLPDYREVTKALFPKAKFAKIPGAGHWLHAEKPREFEAAVRAFLNR